MLTIILPLITSAIVIKLTSGWWLSIILLIILTFYSISWTISNIYSISISHISIIDQISSILITLSILIAAIIILARTKIFFQNSQKPLFLLFNLSLLLTLLLCFTANSLISFYIWFEASLIPTLLIITIWGYQPERIQAGIYLIIYTITASLPILIIFISIYTSSFSLSITLNTLSYPYSININIFWLLLITGFIVKLPIFSTHLWLPKAHVEAPIAGSIVLAAILLKLGGYGLIRVLNIFPFNMIPNKILLSIALYGAVITRLICLRQPDIKSLIAYSSVGHIGIILAGIISHSTWGISSALIIIIAHGLCSSALFIIANITYNITHTRRVYLTKGLLSVCPTLSIWWFLLLSVNIAAPPSLNLLREIILITSIRSVSTISIIILALLRFFTATYSLHVFAITQHGQTLLILNPSINYKQNEIILLIIHLAPLIIIIIKSELIILWF